MREKVLVTGALGSLASAVIPKLLDKYQVYAVDKKPWPGGNTLLNYAYYKEDLTDPDNVYRVMRIKPDYVLQCAASVYGVGGFNKSNADILSDDVAVHNNILRQSVKYYQNVKRVVFISSSMVYENVPDIYVGGSPEDSVEKYPAPYTDYGLSKFTNERLSKAFAKQYGLNYTIWRPFNIITPLEIATDVQGNAHVFADMIRSIVAERMNPIPILGDGEQVRCFTWIDDVAQAIADFSFDDRAVNETINLGRYEPVTMKELAQVIYEEAKDIFLSDTGPLKFTSVGAYKNDVKWRVPNVDKAKNILGWEATKSLRESVRECILEYYKRTKW